VADEGPAQLRRNLQVAEDAGALLTGLMGETRSLIMYPYAWLAVDLLERRAGEGSLARFVAALLEGRDVRSTVATLVANTPEAFEAAVHEHVRARVDAEAGALGPLKDAKLLFQRRRHETARLAFETLLDAHPDSCFAPTARYYRARCLSLLGRRREALEAFRLSVEVDTGRSGLSDEAQLHLGIEHHVLGEDEAAAAELERYVRLHPHSTEQALGYLFLGRALKRLGRVAEARRAFDAVPGAAGVREGLRRAALRELASLPAR
jgi:tetratricopeptide (TPR) repeat protein